MELAPALKIGLEYFVKHLAVTTQQFVTQVAIVIMGLVCLVESAYVMMVSLVIVVTEFV